MKAYEWTQTVDGVWKFDSDRALAWVCERPGGPEDWVDGFAWHGMASSTILGHGEGTSLCGIDEKYAKQVAYQTLADWRPAKVKVAGVSWKREAGAFVNYQAEYLGHKLSVVIWHRCACEVVWVVHPVDDEAHFDRGEIENDGRPLHAKVRAAMEAAITKAQELSAELDATRTALINEGVMNTKMSLPEIAAGLVPPVENEPRTWDDVDRDCLVREEVAGIGPQPCNRYEACPNCDAQKVVDIGGGVYSCVSCGGSFGEQTMRLLRRLELMEAGDVPRFQPRDESRLKDWLALFDFREVDGTLTHAEAMRFRMVVKALHEHDLPCPSSSYPLRPAGWLLGWSNKRRVVNLRHWRDEPGITYKLPWVISIRESERGPADGWSHHDASEPGWLDFLLALVKGI